MNFCIAKEQLEAEIFNLAGEHNSVPDAFDHAIGLTRGTSMNNSTMSLAIMMYHNTLIKALIKLGENNE